MGRWAQRRRGSGGGGPFTNLIVITVAEIIDIDRALLTYSGNVTNTDFDAAFFHSEISGASGTTVDQVDVNQISVLFDNIITLDTDLTWDGANPEVSSPQTISYT